MEDYHVDRSQVYNRNVEPSDTNCPKAFFVPYGITVLNEIFLFRLQLSLYRSKQARKQEGRYNALKQYPYSLPPYSLLTEITSGGYSDRVPPLPIPNREVKSLMADGTWALSLGE